MKTILQKIGPLYGEPVNGTVFGQPNGSETVLPLNIVLSNIDATVAYVTVPTSGVWTCKSDGTRAKYCVVSFTSPVPVICRFALYSDAACTSQVTSTMYMPAKYANTYDFQAFAYIGNSSLITPGTTYYGRVELIANGSIVKATAAITFTGV